MDSAELDPLIGCVDGEWHHEVIDDKLYLRVGDDDNLSLVRDWDRKKKQGISISLRHKEDELRNSQRELADKDGEIRALQERLSTARGSWDNERHGRIRSAAGRQ